MTANIIDIKVTCKNNLEAITDKGGRFGVYVPPDVRPFSYTCMILSGSEIGQIDMPCIVSNLCRRLDDFNSTEHFYHPIYDENRSPDSFNLRDLDTQIFFLDLIYKDLLKTYGRPNEEIVRQSSSLALCVGFETREFPSSAQLMEELGEDFEFDPEKADGRR